MARPVASNNNTMALDVGAQRIGVAVANAIARLPHPLITLTHDENIWSGIEALVGREEIGTIVVGLPRNLNGDDTKQTMSARNFASELSERCGLPIHLQDEALTSRKAESELNKRGRPYTKGDIDALAATYILEDYLANEDGR
jgi:putative Holliday junction resolvase